MGTRTAKLRRQEQCLRNGWSAARSIGFMRNGGGVANFRTVFQMDLRIGFNERGRATLRNE
jgi:hypothetical protein